MEPRPILKGVIAHNFYSSLYPSGENDIVLRDLNLLRQRGHHISSLFRYSDEINDMTFSEKVTAGIQSSANKNTITFLNGLLEKSKIDFVHFHNLFPLIGANTLKYTSELGLKNIVTFHNFRLSCLSGSHFLNGKTCMRCITGQSFMPGIYRKCYRKSMSQSAIMAYNISLFQDNLRFVDRFVFLNSFAADHFLSNFKIDPDKVSIRGTSVDGPTVPRKITDEKKVLFVGRMDELKGIRLLLEAWEMSDISAKGWTLDLIGNGPLIEIVKDATSRDSSITWHGRLESKQVYDLFEQCSLVVIPSIGLEGFPLVLSEALANGRGVVSTNVGMLGDLAPEDWSLVSEPDAIHFSKCLRKLEHVDVNYMGVMARNYWERHLSSESSINALENIYLQAMANS